MKVFVTAAGLLLNLAAVALGATTNCHVCHQPITGNFYVAEDKARGGEFAVCDGCLRLESHCFACGLPVKSDFTALPDGRLLCAACGRDAISSDEEAKRLCLETRDDLDRWLAPTLRFPRTNVVLTIVDRPTLDRLAKSPGQAREGASIFGATQSRMGSGGARLHTINLLGSLSKLQFAAVTAHEFGHAWIDETVPAPRKATLTPDALEGFCELVAYQWMKELKAAYPMEAIKQNPYTRGQFNAFLAAESRHGFAAVVAWMKSGDSAKLDAADPDGVRQTHVAEADVTPLLTPLLLPGNPRKPLPQKLWLRSISGAPGRRFAIINDQTFGTMDRAGVRLADSNVVIRCLEIRSNSVLIRFEDGGRQQELRLPAEGAGQSFGTQPLPGI